MYSESDTRAKLIDPKLYDQWWKESQIEREYSFTDGRILPWWKRGVPKYVDYLLKDYWLNLAIVEAKREELPVTEGLEQVKWYWASLWVRWVYTSNWHEIYEWDMQEGKWSNIDKFPTPEELYERYNDESAVLRQRLLSVPYHQDSNKKPRYYQDLAIQRALTAIAKWNQRILLTLATWTGKTYIAFQLTYKLLQAKWNKDWANRRPRILFLADRNVLIDQAINTFNPLEKDCKRIQGKEIKKLGWSVPTSGNIFFSIYQAIISWADEDEDTWVEIEETNTENNRSPYYTQYDPDFFDLIIIDECHRWGTKKEWNWWEILKYFKNAVQLWMTATPKRDDNNNTYQYFWNPVYEYSLKEGINDWFLTPYKVKRIRTNIDELVMDSDVTIIRWEAEKEFYQLQDFDKEIVVPERRNLIAQSILEEINPNEKTIVFCVDQEHAAWMRDAINENKTVRDNNYCVRITSNEWEIWRNYLEQFQDNSKTIPTIVTSSQMLTTWVDARNVRNIVLLRNISSMTEFKQIIWRGTRVFDGKDYFTILDFTWATELFYDEAWDWPNYDDDVIEWTWWMDGWDGTDLPWDPGREWWDNWDEWNWWKWEIWWEGPFWPLPPHEPRPPKLTVKLSNNKELRIIDVDVRYIDGSWKPMWSQEYLEMLIWKLPELYADEKQLRELWSDPTARENLLKQLSNIWLDDEHFRTLKKMFDAPDSDLFDILTHLSFWEEMKTKLERAEYVRWQWMVQSIENLTAKKFIEYLLWYYAKHWSEEIVQSKLWDLIKLYSKDELSIVDFTKRVGWQHILMNIWKDVQGELFKI